MQLLLNIHNSDMESCKKNNKTKDDLDTSQRCCLVSSACIKLGQCRTPGITYFFYHCGRIYGFHLTSVFTFYLLDWSIKTHLFFSAVLIHTRNILNFLFGYKTNCPKFILAQKLDPLRRGTEIHCHMQCWPLYNFYWYPLLGDKGWHLHKQLSSKCRSSEYPYTPVALIFPVLHPLYSTHAYPLLDLTRAWTLLKEAIKCLHWDNVTSQVSRISTSWTHLLYTYFFYFSSLLIRRGICSASVIRLINKDLCWYTKSKFWISFWPLKKY